MFDIAPTFWLASILITLAPGPDNIFVLTQSALYGKRAGLFVTLGLCTGLLVHTAAVAFGLAAIFQASAMAFTVLKLVGALYLLYLAWQAFKAKPDVAMADRSEVSCSLRVLYVRGIIMNVTNPKVSIFFLAFLPQFADPAAGHLQQQFLGLGAAFMLVAFWVMGGIALLAGVLGESLSRSAKAQHYLNRIAGVVFIGLALKLAVEKN